MVCKADFQMGRRSLEVYQKLRHQIKQGVYPEGGKLPSEPDLCHIFQVSRPTIRRALAKLAEEKSIIIRHGYGTFVKALKSDKSDDDRSLTISMMSQFQPEMIRDIQRYVLGKGYLLCTFHQCESDWDPEVESLFLERVRDERHAGLLAFCTPKKSVNAKILQDIANNGTNVVHIGPYQTDPPKENYLYFDYFRAGYMAAVNLMLAGYKKLVFCRLKADIPSQQLLENGFKEAMSDQLRLDDFNCHFFSVHFPRYQKERIPLINYFNQFESVGVFFAMPPFGHEFFKLHDELKLRIPDQLGILSLQESPYNTSNDVDAIEFNRSDLLKKAIDTVIDGNQIKELIYPVTKKNGSVRT